jgi:hypothetical protein
MTGRARALAGGAGAAVLLAAPAALGFASGGYFAVERLWAALAAMVLAALAAVAAPRALPRSLAGRMAVGGLAGLLGWTVLSRTWAPQAGPAIADASGWRSIWRCWLPRRHLCAAAGRGRPSPRSRPARPS